MRFLALLVGVAAGVLVTAGTVALQESRGNPAQAAAVQHVTLTVYGAPAHQTHPSSFAVRAGVPVQVTVYNYSKTPHTFTALDLGVSRFVPAAAGGVPGRAVFTLTVPGVGVFRWHCALPCGDYLGGRIYAVKHGPLAAL